MVDAFGIPHSFVPATERVNPWRLLVALSIGIVALVAAALGSATVSFVAYFASLVLATSFLVWHRWLTGLATRSVNFIAVQWTARLAVLVAVLIVVACALNALVWATEMAKV